MKHLLREGANMLNIVVAPAVEVALRNKQANKYPIPTMAVSGMCSLHCILCSFGYLASSLQHSVLQSTKCCENREPK